MAKKKKKARPVKSSVAEKKKPRLTKHKEVSKEKEKDKERKVPTNTAPAVPPESKEKLKNGKKRGNGSVPPPPLIGEDGQKLTRLVLIKARHEAIKREIDQIREDLESEEEE